jgi:hypothetical protein
VAQHDLEGEQANHQQKVFAQCFLRRRQPNLAERVLEWGLWFFIFFAKEGPGPDQAVQKKNSVIRSRRSALGRVFSFMA